jgi:hypothetical protein
MARGYARARNRPDIVFNPTIQAVPLERVVGPNIETLILEQVGKLGPENLATLVKLLDAAALRVVTTAEYAARAARTSPRARGGLSGAHSGCAAADRPDEMAFSSTTSAAPSPRCRSTRR